MPDFINKNLGGPLRKMEQTQEFYTLKKQNTGKIAYKVPTAIFNAIITSPEESNLIGFKFAFKEVIDEEDVIFSQIIVYKVYFTPGELFSEEELPLGFLNYDTVYHIEKHMKGYNSELLQFQLKKEPSFNSNDELPERIYTHLDEEWDDKIGFVYFTVDQLYPLVVLYDHIVFSGCHLKLGKKLSHKTDEALLYSNSSFSLKAEGIELKEGYNDILRATLSDSDGPAATTAYPCPPIWRTYSIMLGQAFKSAPELTTKEDIEPVFISLKRIFYTRIGPAS